MNAYIGIGTNIGDRETNIRDAIKALNHLPKTKITDVSAVYETEPWGYTQQDNFYNICVKVETELSPEVLLGGCLGIEASMGRERPFKNAPRIIEIKIGFTVEKNNENIRHFPRSFQLPSVSR